MRNLLKHYREHTDLRLELSLSERLSLLFKGGILVRISTTENNRNPNEPLIWYSLPRFYRKKTRLKEQL